MMSLQALANLAEILGGLAVVISLVYLAIQVRQGTRAQRTENYARALDRLATMQALLSHDGELSRVFSRGVVDPSSLTPAQRTQLTWALYEAFGAFEFMFHASRNDAIPDEVWKRWSEATAWWLMFPGACLVECQAGSVHGKLHHFRGFPDHGKPDRCPGDEAMAGVHLP